MEHLTRTVHHDLPPGRAREVLVEAATRLGFTAEPGEGLRFRRGTWLSHVTAFNPKNLRAWLVVELKEKEATIDLQVSGALTVINPQDRRFYDLEVEALETALLGKTQDVTPAQAEREAHLVSWVIAALVVAAIVAFSARAAWMK